MVILNDSKLGKNGFASSMGDSVQILDSLRVIHGYELCVFRKSDRKRDVLPPGPIHEQFSLHVTIRSNGNGAFQLRFRRDRHKGEVLSRLRS